jgi:hypothetical protein
LTFTPEKFACAVDLVGISNLVTWLNTIPEYWMTWKSLLKVRVSDYTTEAGLRFLEQCSPLNRARQIVRPLLIGQGANDVRVKASESEQIVAAMSTILMKATASAAPKTVVRLRPLQKPSWRPISADAVSRLATTSQTPRSSSRLAAN